jgi:hypothetical protein
VRSRSRRPIPTSGWPDDFALHALDALDTADLCELIVDATAPRRPS